MKKILILATTILATISVLSCQKAENAEIVPVTGVTMNQTEVSLFPGEQVELKAVVSPDNSTSSYKTWSSSDAKIATVDVWGRVNALSPGTAIITAKTASGNLTASCKVIVKEIVATAISLNKTEVTVYFDESETLSVKFEPESTSYKDVKWSSENPNIASVDSTGVVKGIDLGTTTIKATSRHGLEASCVVTVAVRIPTEPEQIELWRSDKASFRGLFGAAADNGKSAGEDGWLHYQDGVVFWAENTSGKLREATLELSTGSKITITQGEAKDIVSKLAFYNYSFKAFYADTFGEIGKTQKLAGDRKHKTAVQLVAVEEPKDLNGHVHNMDIVGLYYDAKVPVSVEFSPEGCKFFTYLSDDYQHVNTGSSYVDVAIITQLTNSVTYGSNVFAPLKFGVEDCNHAWVEWGFDVESGKVTLGTPEQRLVTEGLYFCGFSIVTKGYSEGAYTTIYQLNYQNKWTPEEGAYFERF